MGWASLRKQAQQQSVSLIRVSNDAALIARGVTSVEGQSATLRQVRATSAPPLIVSPSQMPKLRQQLDSPKQGKTAWGYFLWEGFRAVQHLEEISALTAQARLASAAKRRQSPARATLRPPVPVRPRLAAADPAGHQWRRPALRSAHSKAGVPSCS